jgi:Ni/Co efflux regulator RcnB
MKKLMSMILGLSMALGTVAMFAQDNVTKKESTKKAKSTKAKSTKAKSTKAPKKAA